MSSTGKSKIKYLRIGAIILLVVILLTSCFLLMKYWEKNNGLFPVRDELIINQVISYNGKEYELKEDVQTVLAIGLDKFESSMGDGGYNNNQQADFTMLFVIDNAKGTYSAIQLNRDTMTNINILGVAGEKVGTTYAQLTLAHTYGTGKTSCRNTADAVSDILNDVKIEHYVSVPMDAVSVITDLVGGVEVEVKDDFSGIDDTLIMGEKVLLNGDNVLNFVRTRKGLDDSSNIARMERQQEYISSLSDAFNAKIESDENFIINASLELSGYITSNYSTAQLENLMENLSEYTFEQIYTLEGESKVGDKYMEFYADEDSVDKLVLDLFYEPKE